MSLSFDLSPVLSYRFPFVQQQTRAMLIQIKDVSKGEDVTRGALYTAMAKSPEFASGVAKQQVSSKSKLVFVISDIISTTSVTGAIDLKWGGTYFRVHFAMKREGAYGWVPQRLESISGGKLFVQEGQPANIPIPINDNPAANQIPLQANGISLPSGGFYNDEEPRYGRGEEPRYGRRDSELNSVADTGNYAYADRSSV